MMRKRKGDARIQLVSCGVPRKKRHVSNSTGNQEATTSSTATLDTPSVNSTPPKACPQGASTFMDEFRPHLEELQDTLLSLEFCDGVGEICSCGAYPAIYRCMDCFLPHVLCADCTLLVFCRCLPKIPDRVQLIKSSLFPATTNLPATALTLTLLNEMHVHGLCSKKSTHDYHDSLQRLTNAVFLDLLPKRARECGRSLRIYRHLAARRRSGQVHGIDELLPHRRANSLAIYCVACPEPFFNVAPEVLMKASEDERHKYTKFLSIDGNHRLQRKNKNDDPDDVAINEGNAYFVDSKAFRAYLDVAEKKKNDDDSERSTCTHLRASRLQKVAKFKNAAVSGVISVQCARHGLYQAQGSVDMEKGETYARADYALMNALADAQFQRWLMLLYDIWCHYIIHLLTRTSRYFGPHVPIIERLRGAIPKMHVKNHVSSCQARWTPNYIRSTGETCGELIETSWAEHNQTAGATKEQNDGHRHDTLDDNFGFWNWKKNTNIVRSSVKSYKACCQELARREEKFEQLSKQYKEYIADWEAMGNEPRQENGTWVSPFMPRFQNGAPPTQKSAYEALVKRAEELLEVVGCDSLGDVQYINEGLNLEQEQCRIRALAKKKEPKDETLVAARLSLHKKVKPWLSRQVDMFPGLRDDLPPYDPTLPEHIELCLPSAYPDDKHRPRSMDDFAKIEFSLREGQCYDALHKLRLAIQTFNHNLKFKQQFVHGQSPNTRSQSFLQTLSSDKVHAQEKYRRAYQALLNLGLSPSDESLQPLLDNQLWSKDYSKEAALGDSKLEEPWYWYTGLSVGATKEEKDIWTIEVAGVRWCRDYEGLKRCREEKGLKEVEMLRTYISYKRYAEIWTLLASKSWSTRGTSCYGYKQAAMYASLKADTFENIELWYPIEIATQARDHVSP
ncbi:hypothetical protein BDN72DRAFT_902463 [Pluteus cervinus]|uniref:Uncharacterized protein n=1 Tax=Pluteus cervinus TaxID=181527 RepID=A0ACD3ABW0_9AGAR|nr:hypothetical protein BDN72DRAFT_902463 [Pluteus cervinus]